VNKDYYSEDGEDDELSCVKVKETVSDETRQDQWGVRSIDKVQHTESCSISKLGRV